MANLDGSTVEEVVGRWIVLQWPMIRVDVSRVIDMGA